MPSVQRDLPVSVIISAYNSERFIADAIRTVHGQSARPREIIVVDDGSQDRTPEIATALGATVLKQGNAGSSAARNAGTRAASAPWVAYLDVDDLWTPEKLDLQWQALQAAPGAGFSFCEYATFDESGVIIPDYLASNAEYAGVQGRLVGPSMVYASRERLAQQLMLANFMLPSSLVVRRDLILEIGGFDETLRRVEDYDLFLRLLAVADAIVVERRALFYREHSASKSAAWHASLLGKNAVGERIAKNPHLYPAGAAAHFASHRVKNINAAAEHLLRNQRYREARETALTGLVEAPSLRGLRIAWLSLILKLWPAYHLHSALRAFKRRHTKPVRQNRQSAAANHDLSRALPHVASDEMFHPTSTG